MKSKQEPLPEIDTKWNGVEGDSKLPNHHQAMNPKSFREADTPKHCNRKASTGETSNNFANQPYPNHHSSFMNNSNSNMHMSNNYYGGQGHLSSHHNQSAMVSPGGYNHYHYGGYYGQPHASKPTMRPGFSPYGGNHEGPIQYNRGGVYSPYNGMHPMSSYHGSHGSYQKPSSDMNMEFSRAVSTSFSENTTGPLKPAPSFTNTFLDNYDDASIGAESDCSWKHGLNQVASIEEEKFEARNGATTPIEKICPTLSSDTSNGTQKEKRSLFPVPSMDGQLDIAKDKVGFSDLQLCSTESSDLLFSKEPKRERDSKERITTPTMDLGQMSMQEQRDVPPSKKSRSSSIPEERELYSAFSIESVGSFNRKVNKFQKGRNKARSSDNMDDDEHDEIGQSLTSAMPSWDITGQDSFGGGFSVANAEDVLGKSFSFSNDDEFQSSSNENYNKESSGMEKIDSMDRIDPMDNIEPDNNSDSRANVTGMWGSSAHSAEESFSVDSPGGSGASAQHYSQHTSSGRLSMPPLYTDNRHLYHPNGHFVAHHHIHQSMLPPSFRPPPPGMAGPPLTRTAPQPVYMMPSLSGPGAGHGVQSAMKMSKNGTFNWSKADDNRLQDILKKFKNPKDWDAIAKELGGGRTAKECNERWVRYLKPGVRKGQWQDHEDAIVIEAVTTCKEQPFTRWSDLAQKLPGRVGKQIRDRWVNHLNPNINHMPFSKEDDMNLWEGHKQLGKRWVEISTKFFNSSRSENHIKNRWYSASFKKFVANEFGPEAYGSDKPEKKSSKLKKTKREE